MIRLNGDVLLTTATNITSGVNSSPTPYSYDPNAQIIQLTLQAKVTPTTPVAGTFTVVYTTGIFTQTAHGYTLGLVGQASNSGGALPAGLSTSTNYYVIPITANTYYLASSYANAVAGTAITLTGNGTGTQTFTPTTASGMTVGCYGTTSDMNAIIAGTALWTLQDAALTTITTAGTIGWTITEINYQYYTLQFVVASGNLTAHVRYQSLGA